MGQLDQVLLSIDDAQGAICVPLCGMRRRFRGGDALEGCHLSDVTSGEPTTLFEFFFGLLWLVVVAQSGAGTSRPDLSTGERLVFGRVAHLRHIHQLELSAGEGCTHHLSP